MVNSHRHASEFYCPFWMCNLLDINVISTWPSGLPPAQVSVTKLTVCSKSDNRPFILRVAPSTQQKKTKVKVEEEQQHGCLFWKKYCWRFPETLSLKIPMGTLRLVVSTWEYVSKFKGTHLAQPVCTVDFYRTNLLPWPLHVQQHSPWRKHANYSLKI